MQEQSNTACRITAIEPGRRPGRFNIYLDGEFALALGRRSLAELGLCTGQSVTAESLRALAQSAERERALQIAVRYLESRARSQREIEQRLRRSAIDDDVAGFVIGKLRELKLVDDADFAQRWVESRSRARPKGARSLRAELIGKGVGKDEIERALDELSPDREIELAKAALAKHRGHKRVPAAEDPAQRDAERRRLIGFLQRRGFAWPAIKAALEGDFSDEGDIE